MTGRWQTTLKLVTMREYITQWCYYSLFKFMEGYLCGNMKFTREDARRTVLNCAKQYQEKLLNKKLIIIYRERQSNSIQYIEVIFYKRNFQHLTGLELIDADGNVLRGQSENFQRSWM